MLCELIYKLLFCFLLSKKFTVSVIFLSQIRFKKEVDLLKIDIEGSDLNILKTIEIEKLKPKLIMTEAPDADKLEKDGIINYLNLKNYNVIFDNKLNIIFERN